MALVALPVVETASGCAATAGMLKAGCAVAGAAAGATASAALNLLHSACKKRKLCEVSNVAEAAAQSGRATRRMLNEVSATVDNVDARTVSMDARVHNCEQKMDELDLRLQDTIAYADFKRLANDVWGTWEMSKYDDAELKQELRELRERADAADDSDEDMKEELSALRERADASEEKLEKAQEQLTRAFALCEKLSAQTQILQDETKTLRDEAQALRSELKTAQDQIKKRDEDSQSESDDDDDDDSSEGPTTEQVEKLEDVVENLQDQLSQVKAVAVESEKEALDRFSRFEDLVENMKEELEDMRQTVENHDEAVTGLLERINGGGRASFAKKEEVDAAVDQLEQRLEQLQQLTRDSRDAPPREQESAGGDESSPAVTELQEAVGNLKKQLQEASFVEKRQLDELRTFVAQHFARKASIAELEQLLAQKVDEVKLEAVQTGFVQELTKKADADTFSELLENKVGKQAFREVCKKVDKKVDSERIQHMLSSVFPASFQQGVFQRYFSNLPPPAERTPAA